MEAAQKVSMPYDIQKIESSLTDDQNCFVKTIPFYECYIEHRVNQIEQPSL